MQTYVKKEPKKRENWEKTGAQKRGKIKENKTSEVFRGKIAHLLKNARKNSKKYKKVRKVWARGGNRGGSGAGGDQETFKKRGCFEQ